MSRSLRDWHKQQIAEAGTILWFCNRLHRLPAFPSSCSPLTGSLSAMTSSTTSSTGNALNALDTRDVTLPQRLWSWLAKRATENDCSVDEVVARMIDEHRHPEHAQGAASAPSNNEAPPDTAADRLRRVSTRLKHLVAESEADTSESSSAHPEPTPAQQAEQLLSRATEASVSPPAPEGDFPPSQSTGASMFDVASNENDKDTARS